MDKFQADQMTHKPYKPFKLRGLYDDATGPVTNPGETQEQATARVGQATLGAALMKFPNATQNAVAPLAQGEPGGSTQRPAASAVASDATQSVTVPRKSGGGGAYPGAPQPYQVDMTNAQGPGARAATQSYPNIQFNAPPAAVAQGAAGVGGVGLLPPELHAQLADLADEARPLLSSKGITDRLRGRGLMKARTRLLEGGVNIAGARTQGVNAETGQVNAGANVLGAQTNAFRATNEVPLALLGAATQKYGYDTSANTQLTTNALTNETARYANDQNNATQIRAQDALMLPQIADIELRNYRNAQLFSGDREGAHDTATIGTKDTRPLPTTTTPIPEAGGVMVNYGNGTQKFKTFDDLKLESAADKKKALEDAAAAKLKSKGN